MLVDTEARETRLLAYDNEAAQRTHWENALADGQA
jgi:hypothetical protein